MNKKTYNKPELKTRKIELGVFGDYGDRNNGGGSDGGGGNSRPVEVIDDLGLRME